ncbi:secretin N-terminal domain-containing protein [Uliginosibacterium sp. sgz301328]|uniref:secretin N-terminal domain-containing protein n=1 Tax=Uliginosibacterium sp. sgz301328 TaxID=3243764 RepID=UPI00359E3D3E
MPHPFTQRASYRFLRRFKPFVPVLGLLAASGCATSDWLTGSRIDVPARARDTEVETRELDGSGVAARPRTATTPSLPPSRKANQQSALPPYKEPDTPGSEASVVFNAMPLPQFIDSVFGVVLKKTINIDPQVQQRRDLVTMRSGKPQKPSELYEAAKTVLRAYGVTIQELPGVTRFVLDNADVGSLPEIRRGRALPEVPDAVRPIFYLAELENTSAQQAVSWLRTTFQNKVTLQEDNARNAIMISGAQQNVNAALQALGVLDQPLMRGRTGVRLSPVYWSAEELSRRLNDILVAEGYYSSMQTGSNAPVLMIPVPAVNSVIVFANNQQVIDHIVKWVEQLDQPTQARNGNYFIYPVRHADASDIAQTLSAVMGGGQSSSIAAAAAGSAGAASAPASTRSGRAVVDKASNSIIVQASAAEYQQWFGLLKELDRPAKSALVSVSVAEISLNESEQLGFQWFLNAIKIGGLSGSMALSKLAVPNAGLALRLYGSEASPIVLFNALASTARVHMLSNPTILTRSGETATIQVGQEVPVITSQQSDANTNSSNGGVLQTIQYRNTGIILTVRPVVHAGGRIDLDISQEVSAAIQGAAGGALSPSISQRKIQTKLTAMDGNTIVLGGLMSDQRNNTDSGIPWLKDIPAIGYAFKSGTNATDRTELIVLITAYALADDFDAQAVGEALVNRMPWAKPLLKGADVKQGEKGETTAQEADATEAPGSEMD